MIREPRRSWAGGAYADLCKIYTADMAPQGTRVEHESGNLQKYNRGGWKRGFRS